MKLYVLTKICNNEIVLQKVFTDKAKAEAEFAQAGKWDDETAEQFMNSKRRVKPMEGCDGLIYEMTGYLDARKYGQLTLIAMDAE